MAQSVVLHTGLDAMLPQVEQYLAGKGLHLLEVSDLALQLTMTPDLLLIGQFQLNPFQLIQQVYAEDKLLSVIIIAEADRFVALKQALLFTPFIGNTAQCVLLNDELPAVLQQAAERTRRKREYHRMRKTGPQQGSGALYTPKMPLEFVAPFLNQLPVAAVLLGHSDRINAMNLAAIRLFKVRSQTSSGQLTLDDLFDGEAKSCVEGLLRSQGGNHTAEVCNMESQWLEIVAADVYNEEGKTYKMLLVNDITARKMEEERKKEFLTMASHELKTPLTSLKGYIQVISMQEVLHDTPAYHYVQKADRLTDKMARLINDMLDISKIEAGKLPLQFGYFDLHELVKNQVDEVVLNHASLDIKIEGSPGCMVHADRDRIAQVVDNLLNNAIKYSQTPKKIRARVHRFPGHYEVRVTDNGIGIDKVHHEKIFERFYRVAEGNSKMISGFGIGLYLSAEIIQRHNGHIGVESEPGKGSSFYFRLPVASAS